MLSYVYLTKLMIHVVMPGLACELREGASDSRFSATSAPARPVLPITSAATTWESAIETHLLAPHRIVIIRMVA